MVANTPEFKLTYIVKTDENYRSLFNYRFEVTLGLTQLIYEMTPSSTTTSLMVCRD